MKDQVDNNNRPVGNSASTVFIPKELPPRKEGDLCYDPQPYDDFNIGNLKPSQGDRYEDPETGKMVNAGWIKLKEL